MTTVPTISTAAQMALTIQRFNGYCSPSWLIQPLNADRIPPVTESTLRN